MIKHGKHVPDLVTNVFQAALMTARARDLVDRDIARVSANTTWTAGSGNFNTAANWSAGVPGAGTNATITSLSTTLITVNFGSGSDTVGDLQTEYAGLNLSGGTLNLQSSSTISTGDTYALKQSAGLLIFQNGPSSNDSSTISGDGSGVIQTAGTIEVQSGTLRISGNSSFDGTLTAATPLGGGDIVLDGGETYTFGAGASVSVGVLTVNDSGTTIILGENLTYDGDLDQSAGTISLGGHTLTVADTTTQFDSLAGLIDNGTLVNKGTAELSGATIDNGAVLQNSGTLAFGADNQMTLGTGGTATATLANEAGAIIDFMANGGSFINAIDAGQGPGLVSNAGIIEMTATGATAVIDAPLTNTGTLSAVADSTLELNGISTDDGTVSGAGALLLDALTTVDTKNGLRIADLAVGGSGTLGLGINVDYAGSFTVPANLGNPAITLNGHTLSLTGAVNFENEFTVIYGGGVIAFSGDASFTGTLDGGVALINSGTLDQTGAIAIAGAPNVSSSITNAAAGIWQFGGGNLLPTTSTPVSFTNAGEVITTGQTQIEWTFESTGTIDSGTLTTDSILFYDGGTLAGTLSGSGAVELYNNNVYGIAAGTSLTTAALELVNGATAQFGGSDAYAGSLSLLGGSTIALGAASTTLSLSGTDTLAGLLSGTGTVLSAGADVASGLTVGNGITFTNTGLVTLAAGATLGTGATGTATFANSAGGTLLLQASASVYVHGAAMLTNAGLLENSASSGTAVIDATLDSTGTLADTAGGSTLELTAGGSIGGTLSGLGTIDLDGGAAYTLAAASVLSVANFDIGGGAALTITGANSYAGSLSLSSGSTLNLATAATKLTLSGTSETLAGLVSGAGTVLLTGSATSLAVDNLVLGGSVVLEDDKGNIAQTTNLTIGAGSSSTASLNILAKSTFSLTGNASINSAGSGAITNAGTLAMVQGLGTSTIAPLVTNTGSISSGSGTLAFASNVTNDGAISTSDGHAVTFAGSVATSGSDTGTINLASGGLALFGGFVGSAETLRFTDGSNAIADLADAPKFDGTIAGFSGSNVIDLAGFISSGDSFAGGVLTLTGTFAGSAATVALNFSGSYSTASFTVDPNVNGGTHITFVPGHS
jgi:hypothetical protein